MIDTGEPLAPRVNTLRLLTRVELLISPHACDYTQTDVSWVGGANGFKTGKLNKPCERFAKNRISRVPNVE